jgi:DNA-binding transcriptional MerR regulator
MGKYSIKELEKLSGIKAHTIRIWEKRHNIIEPSRTDTNIRFYTDEDLKKIINVSMLNNHGIKISRIANMSTDELNKRILELIDSKYESAVHIDQLVIAMIDMEEELFEKTLNTLILRYGFEKTITEIIYPFLEKIGILWQTQNITPAHEHFISNLIRQKIIVAIDGLPIPSKEVDRILLFLPEGELHELGLLFFHYLTRKKGYRSYYLGQNVPYEDVLQIYQTIKPTVILTSIISPLSISVEDYLKKISQDFPAVSILASGAQTAHLNGQNIHTVRIFGTALELNNLI